MREFKPIIALTIALAIALSVSPAAVAHQNPAGCAGPEPGVTFATETISQLGQPVRPGDPVALGARIDNSAASACDLSAVSIQVRLPGKNGQEGELRSLASNVSLAAGTSAEGFTEVDPWLVDVDEDVFSGSLEITWQATVHNGAKDGRITGSGTALPFTVTRPRAELRIVSEPLSGLAPLPVTSTYRLRNASPVSPSGEAPNLVPAGIGGASDVLSDANCSPLVFRPDGESLPVDPELEPNQTWTFTCARIFLLPGIYPTLPSISAISSVDGRPWPQVPAGSEFTPVRVDGADLTLSKRHQGEMLAGGSGEYRVKVTNSGNQPTSGTVTVVDEIPAGLTARTVSGEGWSCELASVSCTRSDPLGSGESFPEITITVGVAARPPASVTNVATVSGGGEPPGAGVNNSATDPTVIRNPTLPDPSAGKVFGIRRVISRSNGRVVLRVAVPAAGRLVADDARRPDLVRRATRRFGKARTVRLVVKAKRKLRRHLRRTGKSRRVRVRVSFNARGTSPDVAAISTVRKVPFRLRGQPGRLTRR